MNGTKDYVYKILTVMQLIKKLELICPFLLHNEY